MKRCPLCDFIYEDEQGVCDMDGIELVHDDVTPAAAGKDLINKQSTSAGPPRRRRSLHLLLGFGLGAAVFSAYYMSANQAAPASGGQASVSNAAPSAPRVVETAPELSTPPLPTSAAETPASLTEEATPTPAPAVPATEPRAARTNGKRPQPDGGKKKKDSKLSSILNKTGRMLKKPFGF